MTELLVALLVAAVTGAFMALIIRQDERAQREYQEWYEHPDRPWNGGPW